LVKYKASGDRAKETPLLLWTSQKEVGTKGREYVSCEKGTTPAIQEEEREHVSPSYNAARKTNNTPDYDYKGKQGVA